MTYAISTTASQIPTFFTLFMRAVCGGVWNMRRLSEGTALSATRIRRSQLCRLRSTWRGRALRFWDNSQPKRTPSSPGGAVRPAERRAVRLDYGLESCDVRRRRIDEIEGLPRSEALL